MISSVFATRRVWRVFGLLSLVLFFIGAPAARADDAADTDIAPSVLPGGNLSNISYSDHDIGTPAIKTGPDGSIHTVWIESPLAVYPPDSHHWKIHYQDNAQFGDPGAWKHQAAVTDNASPDSSTINAVAIAVDGQNRSHVVWSERLRKGGNNTINIFYRRFDPNTGADGTWTPALNQPAIRLAQSADSGDSYSDQPDLNIVIAQGAPDTIHVVWKGAKSAQTSSSWGIWYAVSTDGGANWGGLTNITEGRTGYNFAEEPQIVAENNGDLHIVWRGGDIGVQARHRIGGTWGKIERIDTYGWWPSLAIDGSGTVYVAYRGKNLSGQNSNCCYTILFSRWTRDSGNTKTPWSTPIYIGATATQTGQFFDAPNLTATDDGRLFLYYMGDNGTGSSGHEIMFTNSKDGGRTWGNTIQVDNGRTVNPKAAFWHNPATNRDGQYVIYNKVVAGRHNIVMYKWSPPGLAVLPDFDVTISPTVNNGHSPYAARAGDSLTLSVTITNVGKADATNVQISSRLTLTKPNVADPPSLPTITSNDGGSSNFNGATATLAAPKYNTNDAVTLATGGTIRKNGGSVTLSFTLKVSNNLSTVATLGSVFYITASNPGDVTVRRGARGPDITMTNAEPSGTFDKKLEVITTTPFTTALLGTGVLLMPGDIIVVTVTAHDTGPTPLSNVTISDSVPPGLQLIADSMRFALRGSAANPIKGKQGFVMGDMPSALLSGGFLKPDQAATVSYRALVTAAVSPGVVDARLQASTAETGALNTATFAYAFGKIEQFARPAAGDTARLAVQLTASPDLLVGIKPNTPVPSLTITLKMHNYGGSDITGAQVGFSLGNFIKYDTLQTKKGTAGKLTGGTFVSIAASKVVVTANTIPANGDATITLQLDLTNTRASLKQTTKLRASVAFSDAKGNGYTTSNSTTFIFGDHDLSDGTTTPRLLPLTSTSKTLHVGKRSFGVFKGQTFQAKEPLAVYAVPPNGATPIALSGSYAATSSGGASLRLDLNSLTALGSYRIVVVGGWSGTVGVGQFILAT